MTPGEVNGLQSLAMAHGGSLTSNPDTGLPEAGILSKLLPTVLGFALGPAGMGIKIGSLSSAASAGLISGAVGTLTSGSLSKGIMAGLGAYGGAQLGGALKGVGDGGFNPLAGATTAQMQAAMGAPAGNMPVGLAAATRGGFATPPVPPINVAEQAAKFAPTNLANQSVAATPEISFTPAPVQKLKDIKLSEPSEFTKNMAEAGRGFKETFSSPDRLFDFAKENYLPIAAVAASMSGGDDYRMPEEEKGKGMEKYRYVYDRTPVGVPAMSSAERDYFPGARYVPTGERYAASGGLMALANGGTVEEMSRLNTIGANTGYPMANQMSSTYASPAERPISENIIRPQGDANVDPYTGAERFADGGYTRYTGDDFYSEYDPKKDDYYYVPGSMGGSGYFMVRDKNQDGAGGTGGAGGGASGFFDPNYYNPSTGTYGGQAAPKAPTLGTKAVQQTKETLNPMYQKYFGRDIDESGLAAYTAKPFSEADLNKIFTGSSEYAAAAPIRAERERQANLATPEQIADIYERKLGRQPDLPGLEYYARQNRLTPQELEKELTGSEEYFKNLTKPFVPAITYGDNGRASIEGAPKYDPSQYGLAAGGLSDLGGYSDGGRLLKGPGDGVSDSIPAVIGERQPARLADGEFVIPARIVSELGNGSTDAGARKLYAMMDRVQKARRKTTGKSRVAANTKAEKYLPA
jgi:hypothetical protein